MDEASQCTMTHAIPLIYRGKTFAAIGDPNQLPAIPTIKHEEENAIVNSLNYNDYPDHLRHDDNNVYLASFLNLFQATRHQILLSEHFRSHPLIIGFSNLNIYYEKYKKPLLIKDANRYSSQNDGISYVQVNGESIKPSSGGSWINSEEANAVVKVIYDLKNNLKNKSMEIGVVTPYRKQVDLIIDMLTKSGLIAGVSVGTAHLYQGQEKDIVIFSTVVSNGMDTNSALWLSKPPNLLNVAMTRARRKLIIVGDMDYCENNFSGDMLGKLAKYCKKIHKLSKISQEQKKLFELLILNGVEPEIEYPIADMHVDFCISTSGQNLVIEVDGDQHFEQKEHDASRDASLRSLGFKVFRTSARDVRETPNVVINKILENIN
jgi:superfamily I DNA and/or RNA helicase